jgi:hypothetical protein
MEEQKKRVWCTLEQKIDALDRFDKGESLQKIAIGFGNSTIKDWKKKNRKDIQSFSMTVEAEVSLESRRTLKYPNARCFR